MAKETPSFTKDELKDLMTAGVGLEQIRNLAAAGFTAEEVLELAAQLPRSSGGGISKQDFIDAMKIAADAGSEGMRKAMHPQNVNHPHISAFSYPEGNVKRPKPELKRPVIFCGHREDPTQLTPAEIDAYNLIDQTYEIPDKQWVAELKRNGRNEELHVSVPMTLDARMSLPPLPLILKELVQGQAAVDPMALAEKVAALERQLAAMTSA